MRTLLLRAITEVFHPRIGISAGPAIKGRPPSYRTAFPDMFLTRLSGVTRYSPSWHHAMTLDGNVVTDHSLVAALQPELTAKIRERQLAAITADLPLTDVPIDGPVYIGTNEGAGTWGHWLVHNLPRVMLFLRSVPDGRVVLPHGYKVGRYRACLELLHLFGFTEERFVFLKDSEVARSSNVHLIDLPYVDGMAHPVVFEIYRNLRQQTAMTHTTARHHAIFLRRALEKREIANWPEVLPLLDRKNFHVVTTIGSIDEQIAVWTAARVVSGVLGSDLTNMLLGNAERLFVITPQWFGDRFFYGLAAGLGIEWNEMVCDDTCLAVLRDPKHASSFNVTPDKMEEFLPCA